MANTTVNKVVLGNETLIDLTDTTATASDVAQGRYFYLASGQKVAGSASGGHVSQDAQGYLVLDDDAMSGAPSGTISITQNGNHDVTNYAQASVDVVQTYTATISGTGDATYCWVKVNGAGTKYYTDGDTFTFEYDDDICVNYRGILTGTTVTANGELIKKNDTSTSMYNYTVETPRCDITIELTFSDTDHTTSNVNFVVPSASVVSLTTNGVASIGGATFANVAVPGMSETDLKYYLARNTTSFTDIDWPDETKTIGSYAFAGCSYFNPPSLPNTVTSIGTNAFEGCTHLALTSLPSGLKTINSYTFRNCTSLVLTSLPSGVTTISDYAFGNCTSLALTSLPSGVMTINQYAFYGCDNLALASLPSGVVSIASYAFSGCYRITISTLPSTLKVINNYAFKECIGITSISCDGAITTLAQYAFRGSSAKPMQLTSASFPNLAITANLSSVFGNTTATDACQLLEFCDIGNAVGIASSAFANCYSLTKLVIRKSTVAALANVNAFTNTPMSGYNNLTGTVYVPSALISTYQTATNWKTLYDAGTVTFSAIEGSDYELE